MKFNLRSQETILFLLSIDTIQSSCFFNFPSRPLSCISELTIQTICPPIIARLPSLSNHWRTYNIISVVLFNLHLPLLVSTTRFSYPSNFFFFFFFLFCVLLQRLIASTFLFLRDSVCFPIKLSLPSRFSLRLYLQEISIWYSNRGALHRQQTGHSIDPTWNRSTEEEEEDSLDPRSPWWWEMCLLLGLTDLFISLYSAHPFYSLTNYPVQFTGFHAVSSVVHGQSSPP